MCDVTTPPGGYFGQALVVDVTDATTRTLPLPDDVLRDYLGGAGLGVWLMNELGPDGVTGYVPMADCAVALMANTSVPLSDAKVSPFTNPAADAVKTGSGAPNGLAKSLARIDNGAAETTIVVR